MPVKAPRRRPEAGGYARGDEVRGRILNAAIELFGEHGFARASTRAIAARAGVNPPALQYYFHNKEGLFEACGRHIGERVAAHLEGPMREAAAVLEVRDRAGAPEAIWALLETVLDHASNETEVPGWTQFLVRASAEGPDTGLSSLREQGSRPLFETLSALYALAWNRSPDDPAARLAAVLTTAQTRAFGTHRLDTLKSLGWPDFDAARLDRVKASLKASVAAMIASPPTP